MSRFTRTLLVAAAVCGAASSAWAFSMAGATANWMTHRLGYDVNPGIPVPGGAGVPFAGPMNIGEEYRWNIPVVYYGFTPDFLNYFGPRGAEEIDKAFALLNELPKASSINPDAYPLSSQRVNHRAAALALLDLKSIALSSVLETMGLANPARFVFTLRARWTTSQPDTTNYFTIRRNFDPISWLPTSYINGQLWTYTTIIDDDGTGASFVIDEPVDPLALLGFLNAPVTSGNPGQGFQTLLIPGGFWTGLTRDDVGGLKYIYRANNYNVENAATNSTGTFGGGPWSSPPGTNAAGSNVVITTGVRAGIEKIKYVRVDYDSLFGVFEPITNYWVDTVITNGGTISQNMQRPLVAPDILFDAADLQGGDDGSQGLIGLGYANQPWSNNNGLNGLGGNYGPGVIEPGTAAPAFVITFNAVNEILYNWIPFDNLDELTAARFFFWGSFDGSTNAPVVYPIGLEIQELERQVLRRDPGFPWGAPPAGTGGGGGGGTGGGGTGTP